ncbi:hypothetical protein N1937_08540 [Rhizobium sp. WSM4643]|uniref:hypothetical protein n=1 Tax=Rhizobium sp. WSM4643 TaxID=3138253 RepID=UPI0021A2D32F|nr:hypothetical protein [Rhizobium leguminosarum]UWM77260.1 hypothetical protein N1937_08540 [Rhizobium leguminosarum bv. viciae]
MAFAVHRRQFFGQRLPARSKKRVVSQQNFTTEAITRAPPVSPTGGPSCCKAGREVRRKRLRSELSTEQALNLKNGSPNGDLTFHKNASAFASRAHAIEFFGAYRGSDLLGVDAFRRVILPWGII